MYPSSSITESNWDRPRVKIVEPESEETNLENQTRFTDGSPGETQNQHRDVPPHQIPSYQPLKPGNVRPEGYKYTPFPRTFKSEPTLKQSRRRLREILEDVEGEREDPGLSFVNMKTPGPNTDSNNVRISIPRTPSAYVQPQPAVNQTLQDWERRGRREPRSAPHKARVEEAYEDDSRPLQPEDGPGETSQSRLAEEEERIRNWDLRGNTNNNRHGNNSNSHPNESPIRPSGPNPPPPPPPPPSPLPPAPSPPPPPPNDGGCNNCPSHSNQVHKAHESIRVKTVTLPDDKNIRDAIARESKLEIRKPTTFNGSNRELWRPFLSDCYRMFSAKPTIYSTEQSKVTYASSWFTGAAARYYQNQVEQEMENSLWIPALHEWSIFVGEFGRLFGLHDEVLHAQSSLDKVIQKYGESFADFIVRFEDAALKTMYNDPAKRWRLLLQIRKDLRDRLTLVGRIPETFEEVVQRLLDIDGAREAFRETVPSQRTKRDRTKRLPTIVSGQRTELKEARLTSKSPNL
ncbi:hypothetical protein K435DRAFT_793180 [Dendrothele bispora CBS 962.96]|uniref:Retrotransposon gag domain-containing protein n=1 Tax=Dendrothele bispora (strain CBS 962.96) TaxID=1314807 RepID=A0A4V4HH66_DENBC|nr:hypothetical protein K435DRAFT_793180 [Dendrothele bispora CBS 962.96]